MADCWKDNSFIYSFDNKGVFTYLSSAITDILGYTPKEFCTHYSAYLTDNEMNKIAQRLTELSLEGKKQPSYELEIYHKNGSVRILEMEGTPVLGVDQEVVAVDGIAHDITEIKRNEKRYRILFNNAPDAIFTLVGKDHTIKDFNHKALDTFRCNPEEFRGITPYEISPPTQLDGKDSKEKACDVIATILEKQAPVTFEWQHRRFDGEVFDAEVSLAILEQEPEVILQAIIRDITDRKNLDKKLRLMQHWVEHSVDLFFWVREDSQVLYVNRAVSDFLGYSHAELCSMRVVDFDMDLLPSAWPAFVTKLRNQGSHCFETHLRHKNGSIFPVEITANLLKYENKDYFFAYGKDISARIKAEKDRMNLEKMLLQTQKLEAIGTLAGGIAHDFNNILSAIIGHAELMALKLPPKNNLSNNLQNILTAGTRAKDLVRQILTFSRKTDQILEPVKVKSIIKETLKLLRASLPATIEIKQHLKSDSQVVGNPIQIQQIIMNLCTNAGHAMRENGGVLEVTLKNVCFGGTFASMPEGIHPGDFLELTITDNGEGMPPAILERIYDPFYTTKERGQGTGMGLAVVHGIVKSLGGTITVHSQPAKGSKFKVYLPAIENCEEPLAEYRENPPKGSEHILLVDDEPDIVEIGKKLLETLGYQVESRTSSKAALALFKAQPQQFDLVITDLTMPQMTGEQLSKELIAIRGDIPIILCSGLSSQINRDQVQRLGVGAVLTKPIVRSQLATTVRNILDLEP